MMKTKNFRSEAQNSRSKAQAFTLREMTTLSLMLSLIFVLSIFEGMLPPLPFHMRFGLSNVVTMYALFFIGRRAAFTLAALKSAVVLLTRGPVAGLLIDRENSTVSLRYPDMRLDVGAVAKGYAVERAVGRVREAGLRSGIINAGGNVAVVGGPLDGRAAWNIGVRAPAPAPDAGTGTGKDASEILDILYLSGGSAVTSGSDQRYFTAEGRRWHHIIDPKTLFPAEGMSAAVTVLHLDSAVADILSTAAFILPRDKARALLAEHGAEALWIMPDGAKLATPGYLKLSKLGGSERSVRKP